jgi:hypothetical protein
LVSDFADKEGEKLVKDSNVNPQELKNACYPGNGAKIPLRISKSRENFNFLWLRDFFLPTHHGSSSGQNRQGMPPNREMFFRRRYYTLTCDGNKFSFPRNSLAARLSEFIYAASRVNQ